jgi:hypothetical protein
MQSDFDFIDRVSMPIKGKGLRESQYDEHQGRHWDSAFHSPTYKRVRARRTGMAGKEQS